MFLSYDPKKLFCFLINKISGAIRCIIQDKHAGILYTCHIFSNFHVQFGIATKAKIIHFSVKFSAYD